jgi:hypothetical protein
MSALEFWTGITLAAFALVVWGYLYVLWSERPRRNSKRVRKLMKRDARKRGRVR